ncbi:hypothetical protein WICPIJ_007397 [Wickerhamomyces pijperi]|uniref:C3H1-type domain-containing protein n=1 Tax=Wickerhamomyces pijperi TaxID=599730 RepID=A0A9P8Q0L5_WICPI|nr:hypothetical protein WICPIJ_007397 [Wickerhamomyces pijperi]
MGISFQEQCNAILDNKSLYEEDQVDMLEDLVRKKFGTSMSSEKVEKMILDIMWKHKDPTKDTVHTEVVVLEEFKTKVDIPSLERRLELQKELLELEAANEAERKQRFQSKAQKEKSKTTTEYDEIVKRKAELYGESKATTTNLSPIDQIYNMFSQSVTKPTIEQALKTSGYNLVDAAAMIMKKLKIDNERTQENTQPAEDSQIPKSNISSTQKNIPCTFLMNSGSCLRSDCPYNHDLNNITCSYWLKGNCFNNKECQFKHSIDEIQTLNLNVQQPPALPMKPSTGAVKYNPNTSSFIPSFNPSTSTTFVPSSASSTSERPKIILTKPLRKPKYTPWENTDHSTHFKTYMVHKTASFKHELQRKKFAQSSTDAWKHNNSHEAKKLSEKANKFEKKYINELKLADDALAAYSDSCSEEIWYEMYGLEFDVATEELADNIKEVKQKYRKGSITIYLVVPPMSDSYGFKRTTRKINYWLESQLYRFVSFPQGSVNNIGDIIGIDPWSI